MSRRFGNWSQGGRDVGRALLLTLVIGAGCATAEPNDEEADTASLDAAGGDAQRDDADTEDGGAADARVDATSDVTPADASPDVAQDTTTSDADADVIDADAADALDSGTDTPDAGRCGNGIVEEGEACDDGNDDDADACTNTCEIRGADVCAPCSGNDECGLAADRCVALALETVCAVACDDAGDCGPGFDCLEVVDVDAAAVSQCVPSSGTCQACPDEDLDGVCDADDLCPGGIDGFDDDGDGTPNACDLCEGGDDGADADADGVADACDACPLGDDTLDADGDSVADACDVCPDGDDTLDGDGDGVPYDCDVCPLDLLDDSDGDGLCDSDDACLLGDDALDADRDGVPDACDPCPNDRPDDSDGDGVCDGVDRCPGADDTVDDNGNGTPDGCDPNTELACEDGVDDDNDGAVDCADPDCTLACATDACDAVQPLPASGEATGTTAEAPATLEGSCGFDGDAPEAVYVLRREVDTRFCARTGGSAFDTRLYVLDACAPDAGELVCADDGIGRQSEAEFVAPGGVDVFLVVDGFDGARGEYILTVTEGPCLVPPEQCTGGVDEDGDGAIDCEDTDCALDRACVDAEVCFDGIDNDLDTDTDCEDTDCVTAPNCLGFEDCSNGREDDGDGLTDCADPDCLLSPLCGPPEVCDNGIDDDRDTAADCLDTDCAAFPACVDEVCDNGVDDNANGTTDCADPACIGTPLCPTGGGTCAAPTPLGFGGAVGVTAGGDLIQGGCGVATGPEDVWSLAFDVPTSVCVNTFGTGFDTVLYARTDCDAGGSEIACNDDSAGGLQSELSLLIDPGQPVALIVDGYSGAAGDYVLSVQPGTCGSPGVELCANGYDDDGDGAVDCADIDCAGTGSCINPDACATARVLPGFRPAFGDTSDARNDGASRTCNPDGTAPDEVYSWTAPRSGIFCMSSEGSSFDTVLRVESTCGDPATELACNDDAVGLQSEVEFEAAEGTTVSVWVDGFNAAAGPYQLQARQGPCASPPTLDGTCAAPFAIGFGSISRSTVAAPGEFAGSCGVDGVGPGHAYVFASPIDTPVCVSTAGSAFDTRLLLQSTCGGGEIACDDDGAGGGASQLSFDARAGDPVFLIVEGYNAAEGDYTLTVSAGSC